MDSESDYPTYFYTCVNVSFIETSTTTFVHLQLLGTRPLLTFANSTALYFLRVLRSLFLRTVSRKNRICLATTQTSTAIQAILGGISLATVIPAMWTIEHVGRRKSLLIGAAIQVACALIAGLLGHYYTDVEGVTESMVKTGSNVVIAFAVIHLSMYSLFWGLKPCECGRI